MSAVDVGVALVAVLAGVAGTLAFVRARRAPAPPAGAGALPVHRR